MPGLAALAGRFATERPLAGFAVLFNMHATEETTDLGAAASAGGAATFYLHSGRGGPPTAAVANVARHGGRLLECLDEIGSFPGADRPLLVVEGNGRLFEAVHGNPPPRSLAGVRGISEHTSGGGRLVDAAEESKAALRVPVIAVYRSRLKTALETGLGTSQSAAGALLRTLRRPVAGSRIAIVGFGHVGRGVARILRILGARTAIIETRAEARLEAALAGFRTDSLAGLLGWADILVTATGTKGVIGPAQLEAARPNLVLANLGNLPDEIDLTGCVPEAEEGPNRTLWRTAAGHPFWLLGGGAQLNHSAGRGNPAELMDISFTLHGLVLEWLARRPPPPGVHPPPSALCEEAARLCLAEPG